MISINFRRGLFRIWIVASVVWLVGGGAVWQKEIRRDVSTLMTAEPATDAVPDVASSWQDSPIVEEVPSPGKWELRAQQIERMNRGMSLEELRASLVGPKDTRTPSRRAQDSLTFAASVILLPPIFAFALGWAGLWILRGFRS